MPLSFGGQTRSHAAAALAAVQDRAQVAGVEQIIVCGLEEALQSLQTGSEEGNAETGTNDVVEHGRLPVQNMQNYNALRDQLLASQQHFHTMLGT